jgi:FAD/FMN-containing dehydrogenase
MRTPVLVFIVVPLSFLQRQRVAARRRFRRWQLGAATDSKAAAVAAERHEANVKAVQSQLLEWNKRGRPCRLRTARPNWASMSLKLGSNKGECHLVETGHMNEILLVDVENLTLVAEPGVTMGELTDALLPLNLALQTYVNMEDHAGRPLTPTRSLSLTPP